MKKELIKTLCEVSGHGVSDHFPDVRKMVDFGIVRSKKLEGRIASQEKKALQSPDSLKSHDG